MPLQHGAKIYCQLLIDVNRYKVATDLAAERKVRLTAMLREMIYDALKEAMPDAYEEAEVQDRELWTQAVQRRVEARMSSKIDAALAAPAQGEDSTAEDA